MSSISDPARRTEILAACTRTLAHPPQRLREQLLCLAKATGDDERADRYGGGKLIEDFERCVAELLGKESVAFMPSGTMAQQIALRIHAQQTGNNRVALHPRSHLIVSEEDAFQRLSGLNGMPVGDPNALFSKSDCENLKEPPGSLLVELPERNIGGALRRWDELVALTQWARGRGVRLHMDGARLWESQPYYARPHAEIAALFDTVYVSFYKGLGSIAGAALAGPKAFIDEARLWQQRHGGRLYQLFPYVVSARAGLDAYLPRMKAYHERAVQVARVLSEVDGLVITPNPPHTNMMHVYIRGDPKRLDAAMLEIAQENGIALFGGLTTSPVPGYHFFERSVGEGAFEIHDEEIRVLYTRLIAAGRKVPG